MATESAQECFDPTKTTVYEQIELYSFSSDPEFQSGLSTILSSTPSQDPELLTLRARCFYFARKQNVPIDFSSYLSWRSAQNLPRVSSFTPDGRPAPEAATNGVSQELCLDVNPGQQPEEPAAPYPSSFDQIVELITKGEPIPGIKAVPDTLLAGQESTAITAKRKKPWERDESVDVAK